MTSGGYVGLSIATLLSQHHKVIAVDIVPEKVELINNKKSPIQDSYIEKYLAEKELNLTATLDAKEAYSDADFVVIAAPTNYDSKKNFFDTSAVAYRLLINLIMQQKKNEVPEELQVFWEDQYLSPIILFEMFRLFDVYSELKGKKIVYQDHPTPKERQDNIFSMFKDDIPEEMNTEEGNKVLNLILNSSEYAEDWLRYKISKGKL